MGQEAKPAKAEKAKPDRSMVEGGEDYEVRELAVATGIPVAKAEELVEKHGPDSDKAVEEARKLQDGDARP